MPGIAHAKVTIMRIDIWSDLACPWCYIGLIRFDKALANFPHRAAVHVNYRTFQLDPTLPERDDRSEKQYLTETQGIPAQQIDQLFAAMKSHGTAAGIAFNMDDVVVANSWTAHRLLHLAKQHDRSITDYVAQVTPKLKRELLAGHFSRGLDLSSYAELAHTAVSVGLEEARVRHVLGSDEFDDAARADVRKAESLGITAVPTYLFAQKYVLPGAQTVETFSDALQQVWEEFSHACRTDGCS